MLEDASQAHDGEFEGSKLGTLGAIGCFSLYPTKNLGALGDAGVIVTGDASLADALRELRNYGHAGRDRALRTGINSRLDEIQAAVLRVKLARLDAWTTRRAALAALYGNRLRRLEEKGDLVLPWARKGCRHAYHIYAIRTPRRDALRSFLASCGIETLVHYPTPIHRQPAYANARKGPAGLSRTETWAQTTLSLPLFPELADDEVERVAEAVHAFFHQ